MSAKSVAIYTGAFGAGALAVLGFMAVSGALPYQTAASASELSVAASASESSVAAASIPAGQVGIADLQRNTEVTVQGSVERVTDEDEFILADATGVVPVWTGTTFFTVNPGETVVVTGFVDDDSPLEIYAQQIVRADGSVIAVNGAR